MSDSRNNTALWSPAVTGATQIENFIKLVNKCHGLRLDNYAALHKWSVDEFAQFWALWWKVGDFVYSSPPQEIVSSHSFIGDRPKWFSGARLNFAENLLRFRDDKLAIIAFGEGCPDLFKQTYRELFETTQKWASALKSAGVREGSRVAGYLPNGADAVHAMLGAATLGAVWCSASPDFGVKGVLDRFSQAEPLVLVTTESVRYNDKIFSQLHKVKDVVEGLPSLKVVVVVPGVKSSSEVDISAIPKCVLREDFLGSGVDSSIPFVQLPPDAPLFIMFSSGTTGAPKCLVHSVAGTLVQITKEHRLHCNLTREDVLAYYTTTGWMMWQWLVTGLHTGCSLVLYDGSPLLPHHAALFDYVDMFGITVLGTGAKWLSVLEKMNVKPKETHSLSSLRCILSTGSPLAPSSFRYVYEHIKSDLMLGSISGGTDIISCFMGCCPILPVFEGEVQSPWLGMGIEVWGGSDGRTPLWDSPGELVCTKPFPSMPTHFLNDEDGSKYRKAYFQDGPEAWRHGDHCERSSRTDGWVMLGRSDATLNPSGVRFGSSEIYQVVETISSVNDSVCVPQRRVSDGEERVVLFVQLVNGYRLTDDLTKQIKTAIRNALSARHVPALILQTDQIPYTSSGKKVEIAVRCVIHGQPVINTGVIANPEALSCFADLPELRGWSDS